MGNSKKGSAFERHISKFLTKWVQGKDEPLLFWRQIASGGLMKVKGASDKTLSGDIHAIHVDGEFLTNRFSIELKNGYGGASFDNLMKDVKGDGIKSFWRQACDDAAKSGKKPMLIFNKTRSFTIVGISADNVEYFSILMKGKRSMVISWAEKDNLPPMRVYDFEEFFSSVTPDHIRNMR